MINKDLIVSCITGLLLAGLLASCQSISWLSVDYMQPADISFPETLKRVAVVNNMPVLADDQLLIEKKEEQPATPDVVSSLYISYWGDAPRTAEALAESLAQANYFDEVLICDSALRLTDSLPTSRRLTREEVNSLTDQLHADFLISLESIRIQTRRQVRLLPEWGLFSGTVDAKVYPVVRIYLPNRQGALSTLQESDSIYWEEEGHNEREAAGRLLDEEEVRRQASQFAGTLPINRLLPHWKSATRPLFGGGSVRMRDALVYAREQQWEEAIALWKKEFDEGKRNLHKAAAHNLAVGHEMLDRIEEAAQWALQAAKLYEGDKAYGTMTTLYAIELETRREGLQKLKMQTQRLQE